MNRYFGIAFLGLLLTYISYEIPYEPSILSAIGIIIGLCLMIGGALVGRIKGYDDIVKQQNQKRLENETDT